MLVQLAATWGWAQCLATPHSTQAPAPSPQREHSWPKRALPAPRPPRPACSVTCGSKHPIKPSCTERVGGSKKGSYLGQGQAHLPANPGLHPTAVYTHLACGRCGTKGHRALQHLLPPALPGHLPAPPGSSCWERGPAPCPCLTGEQPGTHSWRRLLLHGSITALSVPPPKRTQRIVTLAVGRKSQLLVLKHFLWLDLKNHRRFFALLCPNCTVSTIFGTSSQVKIIII